ncbi:MAG: hypothetical protein GTO18_07205 [Anaerolineales bacterium]|nr:hypothetical protein [Anaerolineales bacterium]
MADINVLITLPFPEELLEKLRALSPRLNVKLQSSASGEESPAEIWTNVEVLYTFHRLPEPMDAPDLRWIQLHSSGVDHIIDHPLLRSDVQITTLSGVAAPGAVEFVLMAILGLARRLPAMMEDKLEKRWAENRFERFQPRELRGSTVGIVGYGSIGREIARICRAFGATTLATKRNLKVLNDRGYTIKGLGDPGAELVERMYPHQALASMASLCDFLVITAPLTPETRGIVDEKVLKIMRPSSYIIDISRGGIVDHGALVEALTEEHIAGAALDVFPVEPLPESSPLWDLPNVILSPNIAAVSPRYYELAMDLFVKNMQHYLAEQPLLNRYREERGY